MAVVGGLPIFCPRTVNWVEGKEIKCGREMELMAMADSSEFDKDWAHVYYYCASCKRSLMVNRTMQIIEDPEERI